MTCDEFLRAIDAYLDDELSVMDILRAQGHLLSCEFCHRVMESEAALHSLLAVEAVAAEPPASLRERIIRRVAGEEDGKAWVSSGPARTFRSRLEPFAWLPAALAATALVGLLLLALWIPASRGPGNLVPLVAEVAGKHLLYSSGQRSALEVRGSEPSEMVGWAKRRVGLSLRLPRLDRADDRLVGARVSSLVDAPAAYLLYERDGRRISLFVTRSVPGTDRGGSESIVDGVELYTATLQGVALAWWEDEDEGRLYAAASTGDADAVREFAFLCIRSRRT
jgi:anti-sigma factor RsiW